MIHTRQVVCLRPTPSSFSTKKDSCDLVSIDLDDDSVACFIEESVEDQHDDADDQHLIKPWLSLSSLMKISSSLEMKVL